MLGLCATSNIMKQVKSLAHVGFTRRLGEKYERIREDREMKDTKQRLYKTLEESLHDARHQTYMENHALAEKFLRVADKTLEAIRQLEGKACVGLSKSRDTRRRGV